MSGIYATEPPTEGKVILHTTAGPLDIELWSKQAPIACRNFIQLCLEDYYDHNLFHRVVKDFLVQSGDPTGTGEGGESAYGEPFKDEYHSRLRFSHRGLVACASHGARNTNKSQFFITLGETPQLNNKNTIFGKVTGDSLYNLLGMNALEVDESERPIRPPKIIRAEVVWDPFDVVPRQKRVEKVEQVEAVKPKGVKNASLLSFGKDDDEDEDEAPARSFKMVSRHVALPPKPKRRMESKNSKAPTPTEEPTKPETKPESKQETKIDTKETTKKETPKKEPQTLKRKHEDSTVQHTKPESTTEEENFSLTGGLDDINEEMDIEIRSSKRNQVITTEDLLNEVGPSVPQDDEKTRKIKAEKKALLKELRGKGKPEEVKDKNSGKERLREKRERYLKRPRRNENDLDSLFGSFREALKEETPKEPTDWKNHVLAFNQDENPIVDTHDVEEYSFYDPRQHRSKTEEERRYNKFNLQLRQQKKLEEW